MITRKREVVCEQRLGEFSITELHSDPQTLDFRPGPECLLLRLASGWVEIFDEGYALDDVIRNLLNCARNEKNF